MNKKVFYVYFFLLFLLCINRTLGSSRPSAEEWNDRGRTPAPALVRQAADKLWDTVEAEQVAAHHSYSIAHTFRFPSLSFILQSATNAVVELFTSTSQPPVQLDELAEFDTANALSIQRSMEVFKAYVNFQQVVREHINGRFWFGDAANDDIHDEWIPEQQWQVKLPSLDQNDHHRDMSILAPATLKFVNAWGGWTVVHK